MARGNPNLAEAGKNTKFKKGQSGNPKGRPKSLPRLDVLLADILGEEQEGITAAAAIIMALRKKAVKGDTRAAELLLDRAYGKAKQDVERETIVYNVSVSKEEARDIINQIEGEY